MSDCMCPACRFERAAKQIENQESKVAALAEFTELLVNSEGCLMMVAARYPGDKRTKALDIVFGKMPIEKGLQAVSAMAADTTRMLANRERQQSTVH